MGRPVVLSNGSMFVGLSEQGLVHDFYYPYVGLDNLTNARSNHHKIGVWVDGRFSWVEDGDWERVIDFSSDALVSSLSMMNRSLQIELRFHDFVDVEYNVFCRSITVINLTEQSREVRLFMHQVFQISRSGRADTALFVPEENYLLDYKGRCSLLIYGQTADAVKKPFDQYAIGNYGIEGKEGTFKDAEDGELSNNAVEHGGVDSVMRFNLTLAAGGTAKVDYWIIAGASQQDTERIQTIFKRDGLHPRLDLARKYWHDWLGTAANGLHLVDKKYLSIAKKSLMILKAHIDNRGSVLASGDSSIFNYGRDYYCYCWPRDAALVMWPLIRLGYIEEPRAFFDFCRDVIHPDGYLNHKFQPDRSIGSTWHPLTHDNRSELAIQEDETAIVIYMLGEYMDCSGDVDFVRNLYTTMIQPAGNFMERYIDEATSLPHASYDLWEEKFLTTTYSTYVTQAALRVAARFADMFEYPDDAVRWNAAAARIENACDKFFNKDIQTYVKGFLLKSDGQLEYDNTIDSSSAYGVFMFSERQEDFDRLVTAMESTERALVNVTPSGGAVRYENDWYFRTHEEHKGNPWFVCSLWYAQYYVRKGDQKKAREIVKWVMDHAQPSGVLSEQVDSQSGAPVGVAPLVWSHAELINTVLDLAQDD